MNVCPYHSIKELILKEERKFSRRGFEIGYLLLPGKVFPSHLTVVFSAFNDNGGDDAFTYNYVRTLMDFDSNRLFILDAGGMKGSYYLGTAPDYAFAEAVHELIEEVRLKLNIPLESVICIGSSKGGSAAIYHGAKGRYGGIIAGAPQTKIANYLKKCSPETSDFMYKGDRELEIQGDRIIIEECKKGVAARTLLITSPLDWQYVEHVEPLIEEAGKFFNSLEIIIVKQILKHTDIADYFVENLVNIITDFITNHVKCSMVLDLAPYLMTYNPGDNNLYDFEERHLSIPKDKIVYLQTFDGTFNTPPKRDFSLRMSAVPKGFQKVVARLVIHVNCPLTLTWFLMQYKEGTEDSCHKLSKEVNLDQGENNINFIADMDSSTRWIKNALRFKSCCEGSIVVKTLEVRYIMW